MIAKRTFVTGVLAAACWSVSEAQQPASPAFRFERPLAITGDGARRLPIDVPLLVGASPFRVVSRTADGAGEPVVSVADGLRDLRFYDSSGQEIGYLLVGNPAATPVYRPATILPVAPVDADSQKTSGFEADLGESARVDRFRIDGLEPPFLKRVRLEGSGDREHWTLLVASGTVFDLPNEQLRLTELRFAAGSYRYLRLTWDDTNSARLPRPRSAAAGQPPDAAQGPPITTPVGFERRPSEPGVSRFRLNLPGGRLPIVALELAADGGHVLRKASVYEARLSGAQLVPASLGSGTLRRVVQDELTAASMRIPIEPPTEAVLDLVVADGDNPPFELRGVTAVFADLPWIYLEPPAGSLTARYGNPTLSAPRYDLEAVRRRIRIDEVADASWGEARTRLPEDNLSGASLQLPTTGAALETSLFTFLRTIPDGRAGLIALHLDAGALAHSDSASGRFSDMRVIDAGGRQVPYVIERVLEPLALEAAAERWTPPVKGLAPGKGARSIYRVAYPFPRLPPTRLVLTTSARVFDRAVRVIVEHEADGRRRDPWVETLAQARWVNAVPARPSVPLTLTLPTVTATDLLVVIEEGDNSPLPVEGARILLPSYRLRLFREPAAGLRLAYGRQDLDVPQYDLTLLAPQVLGAPAVDVAPEAEQVIGTTEGVAGLVSPGLFWTALGCAVVVLLALIVRLLKKT